MPAVGPALVAFSTAAASAASAAATWLAAGSIAANLLVSVSLSALQSALARRSLKNQRQPGIKTEYTTEGGTKPMTFIVGRYATAGHMVCPPMSHGRSGFKTPNAFLTYVIALGDVPGQTLESVIIDDEEVKFEASEADIPVGGAVPSGHPGWWYTQQGLDPANPEADQARIVIGRPAIGDLSNNCWIRYHDGRQTEADPFLLAIYGEGTKWDNGSNRPWTSDMVGKGTAYIVITFRFERELFSGLPRCKFVMGGIPLYDPRKDTTVGGSGPQRWSNPNTWASSENPLVQTYNVMRGIPIEGGPYWGLGAEAEDLPVAAWTPAMNACDEIVDGVARYRAGIEIGVDDEPLDIIEDLLKTCSAQLAEFGGVWKPRVGGPKAPVYFFDDSAIVLSESQSYKPFSGLADTYNGVQASYPEPKQLWQPKDAPPRYSPEYEAADQGKRKVAQLSLPACPYQKQVQRLTRALLHDNRRFRRHQITLPPEADVLEALDSVGWTSGENGYVGKIFEATELAEVTETCNVQAALRERDNADYDWSPDFELPSSVPATTIVKREPVVPPSFTAEGISLKDAQGRPRRPAARLRWGGWGLEGIARVFWEIRQSGAIETMVGAVDEPESGQAIVAEGILPDEVYEARIKFFSSARDPVDWTGWVAFKTPAARLVWDDLADDVRKDVTSLEDWANGTGGYIRELRGVYEGLRDAITEVDFGGYTARKTSERRLEVKVEDAKAYAVEQIAVAAGPDSALALKIEEVKAVVGDAEAGALDIMVGDIQTTKDGLAAHGSRIMTAEAQVGRVRADGLLRISAEATPAGAISRIGLRAEATDDQSSRSAALYLEASTGGVSKAIFVADRFAIVNGDNDTDRRVPFIIQNGVTYIDVARIKDKIQSDNFVAGPNGSGWRIDNNGTAEFNNVIVRRQIEVASGSRVIGSFTPTGLTPVPAGAADFAIPTGSYVNLVNGPGRVLIVTSTPIAISEWLGAKKTYIATVGMTDGVVFKPSGASSRDVMWGWTADVLPLTQWDTLEGGAQCLRLRLSFWSQNVTAVENCTVTWKIYEVS